MPIQPVIKILFRKHPLSVYLSSFGLVGILVVSFIFYSMNKTMVADSKLQKLSTSEKTLQLQLQTTQQELTNLKNQDQVVINKKNQEEIKNIQTTYSQTLSIYEKLTDLKTNPKVDTTKYDELYAKTLKQLADKQYTSAAATLADLNQKITDEQTKIAAAKQAASAQPAVPADNAPVNNAAPGSGFSRQKVGSDLGDFVVDIIAADLGSTRVIVDTASDHDCHDNCPVLSLGDYVARSGAFAGINGTYFCPASYPQCAGKTNTFDLLVMNKNKTYFNSDNNVYSNNPAVIFSGSSARFVGRVLEWGRDTSVDAVISNYPLLLSNNNIQFNGDGDPKKGSKGPRSFVASKGSTVYIGVVYNATVAESAHALKALGIENAMNLDSGGSTALWFGGYKAGPGRALPNALLFVRK